MSFWDNFSSSINKAGQTAIQKTRDLAGIASLNSEIADSNRKINNLEQEIGRIVMDSNFFGATKEQVEEVIASDDAQKKTFDVAGWKEILSRATAILSEEETIADKEKQVALLRGTVTCPNCGKAVPRDMAYCPNCGTKMPVEEKAEEVKPEEEKPEEESVQESPEKEVKESSEKEENSNE